MALTEQEKQIVEFGKKSGKSQQEIIGAISKYRSTAKPAEPKKKEMSGQQADKFLNKSTAGQIFSKETLSEVPKAAYDTVVGGGLKFIKSAVTAPKNIVEGIQGKPMTSDPGKGFMGEEITTFQQDFQDKTLPAVESGEKTPLGATAETVGGIVLGAVDTLGAGELVSGSAKAVKGGVGAIKNGTSKIKTTVEDAGSSFLRRLQQPDVSEATKVSLNPKEALKDSTQDIQISVGGKLKPLSEVTINESTKLKSGTKRNIDSFTKQAEKFSKDRSTPGGSPVEIVGSRTDKALDFADRKRQIVGKKMGEIEDRFADQVVPIKESTFKQFADVVDYAKNPKYGVSNQNAPTVGKFIDDFDTLNKEGLTVAERNNFVRRWQEYLQDAKDPFGNFKENATANTKIQNAVSKLKNETVESISDKTYRNLRKQYAEYKKLEEIGNQLLGRDGLLGERIKGAATIKRAIQSNSDAGARQFLIKLRDLTGYDAIKEGDLALTAMENVGDYQGLNLLNIIKEGKSGIINRALEKGQDLLVGDKSARVIKYINK